ncbi:mitogen-activated protein kinase kinase kinase 4 [Agrilus planipennis]|uniref:Mitogen-activated protein kinase kinase kinase 4 n=1 Tax=Agrilus planipennis TaxID=224129 RepID=A0A7F5R224_AGRPL|nr:mitogen-activated protein kinase kinase kinase 4 [Agrilus planipennis]
MTNILSEHRGYNDSSDDSLSPNAINDDFFEHDSDYSNFDQYSATPPRTRVLRKHKERKRRSKENSGGIKNPAYLNKMTTPKVFSRSMSASQLNSQCNDCEESYDVEEKKSNKRLLKMLRNSERDLKLDIRATQGGRSQHCKVLDGCSAMPMSLIISFSKLYKEMSDIVVEEYREKLAKSMVHFVFMWMKFATERCERGRGMRPRWAYQGLEFLLIVCDPKNTAYLTDEEFEELKNRMDACISHVIGTATVGTDTPSPKVALDFSRTFPRSRASSPNLRTTYRSQRKKKSNKRLLKMLRNSERDLKLDIRATQGGRSQHCKVLDGCSAMPVVEGCKRFMSLYSRRVTAPKTRSEDGCKFELNKSLERDGVDDGCPQNRVDFHKTLSLLIKMGCGEKQSQNRNPRRNVSREEVLWQNELKDIIWLELQAWHADRTPAEQDDYLCTARDSVEGLLNEIMNYKFQRAACSVSGRSLDSGISGEVCDGCISMFCGTCLEVQNQAVRDVECLMNRLEEAESLFPSSKAFGEHYPLYTCPEFIGRVRAMCLWYNTVKHLRLMLLITGKLFAMVDNKIEWSVFQEDSGFESTSPSDSNNSSGSADIFSYNIMDFVSVLSIGSNKVTAYRKYIENILKTRGVEKSLSFLAKLHKFVLEKAKLTLEKPDDSIFSKTAFENQEDELHRYGTWSPEAIALSLPSYKSIFLFLCVVPLNMVQEFLNMRLEQKPNNPSPLSLRHLIRELKQGLQKATSHRKWFVHYISIALVDCEEFKYWYEEKLAQLDGTVSEIFDSYLTYLEQLVLLEHETFPKSFLEEEWCFSSSITELIPGGKQKAEDKFMLMLCSLMKALSKRLINRIEELTVEIKKSEDEGSRKHILSAICHSVQSVINEEREKCGKMITFLKSLGRVCFSKLEKGDIIKKCLSQAFVSLKCTLPIVIEKIESILFTVSLDKFDDIERSSFVSRSREILQQAYRFGFELYKEMSDIVVEEYREKLAKSMVHFVFMWMKFATERCERGRGMRPRWAYQGLEFLLIVCDPKNTAYLTDEEFEELKNRMDACISHVIGTATVGTDTPSPKVALDFSRTFPRSRASSPNLRTTYRSQRSNNRKTSTNTPPAITFNMELAKTTVSNERHDNSEDSTSVRQRQSISKQDRIRDAVEKLDNELEMSLREHNLIGKVVAVCKDPLSKVHIRRRYVNFSWQRGIKIGQGRFGKVYTAVNNTTGEMMAVKEISLQQNDTYTIKRTALELKILEGISHENLVKYYGLEVHKEEMLLFMEYCEEGSLENLISGSENGLPELLIRKYTYQLLSGLAVLHCHGIVHRDIKSANIFLTDKGNRLKIGDFGCAAKIRAQVTVHGELQGFVGTQAYMAPEVFMKTNSEGHGRSADIWSVGCVVIEMASGKVNEFKRINYFKKVLVFSMPFYNPKDRATALELLHHNFVKVGDELV